MVVAVGKNGMPKQVIQGNIDLSFICEDIIVIFSIQEVRLEGNGDVL